MDPTTGRAAGTAGDLVIDAGNTRCKLGWFVRGRCLRTTAMAAGDTQALTGWLGDDRVERIAIGAVTDINGWLKELSSLAPLTLLRGDQPSPLKDVGVDRRTLGTDRLANAVAAYQTFPGRPALAIGLGTCIIYDVVAEDGTYLGGAISPGMRMRAQAMNSFSARLPLADPDAQVQPLGTDTMSALLAGIHQGITYELQGWIRQLRQQHPGLAVVLTGGDAVRFSRALKSGIFADPSLTLRGLHALMPYALPSDGPAGAAAGR